MEYVDVIYIGEQVPPAKRQRRGYGNQTEDERASSWALAKQCTISTLMAEIEDRGRGRKEPISLATYKSNAIYILRIATFLSQYRWEGMLLSHDMLPKRSSWMPDVLKCRMTFSVPGTLWRSLSVSATLGPQFSECIGLGVEGDLPNS